VAAEVTVVEQARWFQELANLTDQGEPMTEDTHKDCPGHAATLHQQWSLDTDSVRETGYRAVVRTVWVCTDPRGAVTTAISRDHPAQSASLAMTLATRRQPPSRPGPSGGR